jgi:hypothetical protein
LGKKTAANYVISKNAQGIVEDTAPELCLDELFGTLSSLKLYLDKVQPIHVVDLDGKEYDLKPDRRIRGTNILVHVDGKYHETDRQENKDAWKDGLLNGRGDRNFHIRAELLTVKRFWAYVGIKLFQFIISEKLNDYLYA